MFQPYFIYYLISYNYNKPLLFAKKTAIFTRTSKKNTIFMLFFYQNILHNQKKTLPLQRKNKKMVP